VAIALLTHTAAASTDGNDITTSAINSSGANLLIGAIAWYTLGGSPAMQDSKSNTWTPLTQYFHPTLNFSIRIFYAKNPGSVGTGHTFSSIDSGTYSSIAVATFSGADTTAPFDVQNGNSSTSSLTSQPGSVTPGSANELLITAAARDNATDAISIDSGFAITDQLLKTSFNYGIALAYLIETTIAAQNPTWTESSIHSTVVTIATFKVAASGGGFNLLGDGTLTGGGILIPDSTLVIP